MSIDLSPALHPSCSRRSRQLRARGNNGLVLAKRGQLRLTLRVRLPPRCPILLALNRHACAPDGELGARESMPSSSPAVMGGPASTYDDTSPCMSPCMKRDGGSEVNGPPASRSFPR